VLVGEVDTGLAFEDHVALLADPALLHQDGALLGLDVFGELGDTGQLLVGESVEEGHTSQLHGSLWIGLLFFEHHDPCLVDGGS